MNSLLSSEEYGATKADFAALGRRDPFSAYLPYDAYDANTGEYYNRDNTIGRIWECRPLTFLSQKTADSLAGMLRQDYPAETIFQFILYPDDHIDPIIDEYVRLKTRDDELIQEAARRYADHLRRGAKGMENLRGIPVRNFRLFVAVKSPVTLTNECLAMIEESLSGSGFGPRRMEAGRLLEFLRRLFNRQVAPNARLYDDRRYIRNQVINAETRIEVLEDKMALKLGDRWAACISPKGMPDFVDNLPMNRIVGGYSGPIDDSAQILHRFLWCTTIFFDADPGPIKRKASVMSAQRVGGSLAKALARRNSEMSWVLDELDAEPFCNMMTCMWVFGDDEDDLNKGLARAKNLWQKQGYVMQREDHIQVAMFLNSLPFGLVTGGESMPNVSVLQRDFQMSVTAAAKHLPVQADFGGNMRPVLLYIGRKGQLVSVDVFDKGVNNHNYLVCAGSGAGKSFSTNFLVNNYHATGAKIRIVDIGGSYEKQCLAVKGGRYIDVGAEAAKICINPFAGTGGANETDEDRNGAESVTVAILLTMIYSSTNVETVTQTQYTLLKDAQRYARSVDGGLRGIDHVRRYLAEYPKLCIDEAASLESVAPLAREMAFNLRDFCSPGKYGAMFNGPSTLNIGSDDFVVMELDNLRNDAMLYKVVSMQVISMITRDLFLSDRADKRFILFDEAHKYFRSDPMIADIIIELYRMARKYGGSAGIVTQSPLDLLGFGPAGVVMKSNSAFKFFLESEDYKAAVDKGVLEYEGLLLELARGVKNNKPDYSEILFDTPFGAGVGRLAMDRWMYWMYTSAADERAAFKSLVQKGLTPRQAIDRLAGVA